jgi:hypothetical protein
VHRLLGEQCDDGRADVAAPGPTASAAVTALAIPAASAVPAASATGAVRRVVVMVVSRVTAAPAAVVGPLFR